MIKRKRHRQRDEGKRARMRPKDAISKKTNSKARETHCSVT